MRKVTEKIVNAFLFKEKASLSNTHTDGTTLYLHNNAIARHTPNGLEICTAGWTSNTTKERLNALPNVSIQQKAFNWYLNGRIWDNNDQWTNLTDWNTQTIALEESKDNFLL